jgi:hypothetical protein
MSLARPRFHRCANRRVAELGGGLNLGAWSHRSPLHNALASSPGASRIKFSKFNAGGFIVDDPIVQWCANLRHEPIPVLDWVVGCMAHSVSFMELRNATPFPGAAWHQSAGLISSSIASQPLGASNSLSFKGPSQIPPRTGTAWTGQNGYAGWPIFLPLYPRNRVTIFKVFC